MRQIQCARAPKKSTFALLCTSLTYCPCQFRAPVHLVGEEKFKGTFVPFKRYIKISHILPSKNWMTSFWNWKAYIWLLVGDCRGAPSHAVQCPTTTPSHIAPHLRSSKSSLPKLTNFLQVGAARLGHIWQQAAALPPVTWGRFYRVDKPRLTHGISLIWSHNPPPVLSDSCPAAFLSPLCSSSITD